jgi:hypothetical protein
MIVAPQADALFAAIAGYRAALAARADDPQAFKDAEVALKAAIDGSGEAARALGALSDADDIEVLEGMLEQVNQTAARASAAVDEALTDIAASNDRMTHREASYPAGGACA